MTPVLDQRPAGAAVERAREAAASVPDPEVPVLTIADLGVLLDVTEEDGRVVVTITPTYSGCPAMDVIRHDVLAALASADVHGAEVRTVLVPAWTTHWMSDEGRRKLAEYGIAPPLRPRGSSSGGGPVALVLSPRCPHCSSPRTRELSRFGSTACKSLWVCRDCSEPFDHFKDH